MAEVWTKTELKAADNVMAMLDGFPEEHQDAILAVVRVLLDHERRWRQIAQELAEKQT